MKKFAEHVLSVVDKNGIRITNLQLQKIMYFSVREYIAENGVDENVQSVYSTPFEAWLYGPVVPKVYRKYKSYGRMTIDDRGMYHDEYERFDAFIKEHIKRDAFEMVEDSHGRYTWDRFKEYIRDGSRRIVYGLEDLSNDFRQTT